MRRLLVALFLALLVFSTPAKAARPLRSFTILTGVVGCTGDDFYINPAHYPLGAGIFPTGPSVLVGYQIWSHFRDPTSYLMIGKTQPYGDAISPYIYGTSSSPMSFYQGETGFPFDPTQPATEQIHIHYLCSTTDTTAWFGVTIVYTLNSDPNF